MESYFQHPKLRKLLRVIFVASAAMGWFFVLLPLSFAFSLFLSEKIEELMNFPRYTLIFKFHPLFASTFHVIFSIVVSSSFFKYMDKLKEKMTVDAEKKGKYYSLIIIQVIVILIGLSIWIVGQGHFN